MNPIHLADIPSEIRLTHRILDDALPSRADKQRYINGKILRRGSEQHRDGERKRRTEMRPSESGNLLNQLALEAFSSPHFWIREPSKREHAASFATQDMNCIPLSQHTRGNNSWFDMSNAKESPLISS